MEFPHTSRKTATPLIESEKKLDEHGVTNPDLYRRIDGNRPIHIENGEVLQRDYKFTISGAHSYRTIRDFIQDEDSDISEIP